MSDAGGGALLTLKDIDRAISELDMENARLLAKRLHHFVAHGSIEEMHDISVHLQRSLDTARKTRESLKKELKTVLGKRHGINVYQRNDR